MEFCKSEFSSERPLSEGLKNGLTFEIHAKLRYREMPEVYIVNLCSKTDFITTGGSRNTESPKKFTKS